MHMCDMTSIFLKYAEQLLGRWASKFICTYVWHASFVFVTWLIYMCDMTHLYVWHDSFIFVTWLTHFYACEAVHSYVCHESFMRVTGLIYMSGMTHSKTHSYARCRYVEPPVRWWAKELYVSWLMHTCGVIHTYVWWRDWFMCMACLISTLMRMCDIGMWSCSFVSGCQNSICHDRFILVTWLMHMCGDVTYSCMWHVSFKHWFTRVTYVWAPILSVGTRITSNMICVCVACVRVFVCVCVCVCV